jgi:A/G-specific adenine glycosylase
VVAVECPRDRHSIEIGEKILVWAGKHGRCDLPWQQVITPYKVWISEVMLQQTQVAKVIPFFERFLTSFPTPLALAAAAEDDVLAHWSGLGYYSRARNLMQAARIVVERYGGQLPCNLQALQFLPGLGRSTAAAILSIGYEQRAPILDGNVKRVLARLFAVRGWPGEGSVQRQLWARSDAITPDYAPRAFTQAVMDFGATLCTRTEPACHTCPLTSDCEAVRQDAVADFPQSRPARSKPVRAARFLVVKNSEGELLLIRNDLRHGVWQGLWIFPQCRPEDNPPAFLKSTYGLDAEPIASVPAFRHTFSHYHLDIHPLILRAARRASTNCKLRLQWCGHRKPLSGGVPTPVQRLFGQFSAP